MGLFNKLLKNKEKDTDLIVSKLGKHIPNIEKALRKITDKSKVDELEKLCGKDLPKEFKNIYLKYNGETGNPMGLMAGLGLMEIEAMINCWKSLQDSAYKIISSKEGFVQEGNYKKGWIPFAEDWGGSYLAIDLVPGKEGAYGQVITIDRNSDNSYVIANSFEEFLEQIAKGFEKKIFTIGNEEYSNIIKYKNGHIFDDIFFLTGTTPEDGTTTLDEFWQGYFINDVVDGKIDNEELAKKRMLFLKSDEVSEKPISLEILKKMTNLTELIIHVDNIKSFEEIKYIQSLTKVVIGSKAFKEKDLQYIIKLKNIKELTLVRVDVRDLAELKNSKTLKTLSIYNVEEIDGGSLGELSNLNKLSLELIKKLDLSHISNLKNLKELKLKDIEIPNLSFLDELKHLMIFETDRKAICEEDITIINQLPKLMELIYPIGDMELIKGCKSLKEIGIDAMTFKNIDATKNLKLTSVTIFNSNSQEYGKVIINEVKKYHKLSSYGFR